MDSVYCNIKFRAINKKTGEEIKNILIDKDGQIGELFYQSHEGFGAVATLRKCPDARDIEIELIK